jgi:hypothetical protein
MADAAALLLSDMHVRVAGAISTLEGVKAELLLHKDAFTEICGQWGTQRQDTPFQRLEVAIEKARYFTHWTQDALRKEHEKMYDVSTSMC